MFGLCVWCSESVCDGVVLAPGVTADSRGMMLAMDAATWPEEARVELPFGVPKRFHGMWRANCVDVTLGRLI